MRILRSCLWLLLTAGMNSIRCLIVCVGIVAACLSAAGAERLRVVFETDAGGDPDDEQSIVRLLLYGNEWDVEGIICNRPKARDPENPNPERTGLGIVLRRVKAYGECYPNSETTDPDQHGLKFEWMYYPEPGSYRGPALAIEGATSPKASFIAPKVESAQTIHIILMATDEGSPPLTRYQRVVVTTRNQAAEVAK